MHQNLDILSVVLLFDVLFHEVKQKYLGRVMWLGQRELARGCAHINICLNDAVLCLTS